MADRYRDYDRDDRPGDAWRERDERWRGSDRDRSLTERAADEVRSWIGDDEARRRREMDERRDDREGRRGRSEQDYRRDRDDSWRRRDYSTGFDRDRGERWSGGSPNDLNRERDFGRSDRYANTDEGAAYGSRAVSGRYPGGYSSGRENYRGTSGYETARETGSSVSGWPRGGDWRSRSSWDESDYGPYTGRGPRGYQRSDERIREDVCERLTRHGRIDASDINIRVANGEVTLEGSVQDRDAKRLAEDVAEDVFGVRDVNNQLKVHRGDMQPVGTTGSQPLGEAPRSGENANSVLGLAGTANTPEMTPPDRKEPKKG